MMKSNGTICVVLVMWGLFLGLNSIPAWAENDPSSGTNGQPVSLLHNTVNRILPLKTVWDIVQGNVPDSVKDFWGTRGKMEERGITFSFVYTGDMAFNVAGGTQRGSAYLGNLDMSVTVDTAKLGLWNGGTFYIYGISNFGKKYLTGEKVGDTQGVDNIEAPHTTKLFEAWYEQKFFDGKFSVLAGLHDLNSEFDTNENGGDLLNSSFGIQPTMTGNMSVSVFPAAGPSLRLKLEPNETWTFLAGVFDGAQGDPGGNNRHGIHNSFNKKSGTLSIAEVDYHMKLPLPLAAGPLPGTLRAGGWYHDHNFDDVSDVDDNGNPVPHDGNFGWYFDGDQTIFKENADEKDDQGLGVFVQLSQTPQDRNTISFYRGMGLRYKGLIPHREADTFSIGMAQAFFSDSLRDVTGQKPFERVFEVTYKAQMTPALVLQPDIQFVKYPGGDPAVKSATVAILRTQISFERNSY